MRTLDELQQIVGEVGAEGLGLFRVGFFSDSHGRSVDAWFVQHYYMRPDVVSHDGEGYGYGRKWYISRHATRSEIVLTCLKAGLTNSEHEFREQFTYRGQHIFQPHINVDHLWELMIDNMLGSDARPLPPAATDDQRREIIG